MAKLTVDVVREKLAPLFARFAFERAFVFGSVARGEASRRSDVDLIAILDTDKRFFDRYDGIYSEIRDVLRGCSVDLLIYTPQEFADMPQTAFMRRVLKDCKVIYERKREQEPPSTPDP